MLQENKDVALRWVEEVWNQGRIDLIDELHAENYVRHHDSDGGAGREHYKRHVQNVLNFIPDSKCTVEHVIAEGDMVVLRLITTGTHLGRYGDIEPTGRPVEFQAVELLRITDGQIVESWHSYDRLSFLAQIGAAKSIEFADAARAGSTS
jgi:steroid delta-isomerase-like uncharacterized protein